jgi:hypothetical protein
MVMVMQETNINDEISKNLEMVMKQEHGNDDETKTSMQQKCLNDVTHFAHSNHHKQKTPMECNVQQKPPRF